ncbi:MAG: hypothetical protein IK134_11270 [Oscillospiraceae bacterium]|nr:hypothetical protein [Oscillospiraceae bacterium]
MLKVFLILLAIIAVILLVTLYIIGIVKRWQFYDANVRIAESAESIARHIKSIDAQMKAGAAGYKDSSNQYETR